MLGQGSCAIKEALRPHEELLCAAGYVILVIYYRTFGSNGGDIRGQLFPAKQVEDCRSAITYLQRRPEMNDIYGTGALARHRKYATCGCNISRRPVMKTDRPSPLSSLRTPVSLHIAPERRRTRSTAHGAKRRSAVISATIASNGGPMMRACWSRTARWCPDLLVDQCDADQFMAEQLKPELLREGCDAAGIALTLRMQPGYDHSYYFVPIFMADHTRWHAERLG